MLLPLMPAPHTLVPPSTHGFDGCSLAVMGPQRPGAGDRSCCPFASHQPPLVTGTFLIRDRFPPSLAVSAFLSLFGA